jgi:2-oxoglutarate dehydrogenase E2 component (dihydrolipoamide succinyltransferase)
MTDILVPTLGESVTEATVAKWLKEPGDAVKKDDPLVELETDKVSVEVPAPSDGTLDAILADVGATVEIGALLGTLKAGAGAPTQKAEPNKAVAPSNGGSLVDVTIPQMGESVSEGSVGRWMVAEGDTVSADDPLVEIETDKVAVEVPAPVAGVVRKRLVQEGDTVAVGAVVAHIEAGAAASASVAAPHAQQTASSNGSAGNVSSGIAMPSAQRVLNQAGMSASEVDGTGRDGRVTKADAKAAVTQRPNPPSVARAPQMVDPSAREERVAMSRLRQTIARRLKDAQNSAAMLTTFNDVDMTAIIEARGKYKDLFAKKHGVKLGFMSFFVKACIQALKDVPAVNAEIDGTDIVYKNYYDIGIAVGTEKGLVVPVVRGADDMSLGGIEKEIGNLGVKARDGQLTIADMQGATFTITNGGIYGSLLSTPILNAPQSGILGMHRIEERPVALNGQVVIRPMMYLALSYDHRIVDGKEAVTFLVRVKECLEDPDRLLLDL